MRRWHNRSWGWMALTLGLTPAFFFLEHWGPEGLPTAEGCGGSGTGASSVRIWGPFALARDLATDGFFVLDTYTVLDPEPLVATTQVSVTKLDGVVVAGKLFTVRGKDRAYLAWQADAPIEVGTKLKVVVEGATVPGAPVVPDQAEMEVTGEPAALGVGALGFDAWFDYRHGVGEQVTCDAQTVVSCKETTTKISVFAAEQSFPAVSGAWQPAKGLHGFMLWEVDVTPTKPASGLAQPPTSIVVNPSSRLPLSPLVFAEAPASYCVTIRVKDLRSGDEKSIEQCKEPGKPLAYGGVYHDFPLWRCNAPPSEALTQSWCEAKPSTSPVCQPAPSEPMPSEPMPSEPMPSEPMPSEPMPQPTSNAASGASRTSTSCQVALVGASAAGGAVTGFGAVAALLTLLRRRRERLGDGSKS